MMPAGNLTVNLPHIDTASLYTTGDSLITKDLIVFPVRHHSVACSWYLNQIFDKYNPSAVLIEGPSSFNGLIPFLVDDNAKMPLAIYSYSVKKQDNDQESRHAAYYPFCDYSPEYIALKRASALNIPSRFIDLDYSKQLHEECDESEPESLLDEHYFSRSTYLKMLAEKCGCRDHEELWEHLFETTLTNNSAEQHIKNIAYYCSLSRITTDLSELAADGTIIREQEMVWHIKNALLEKKSDTGPILVVVGGFHAVVIPSMLNEKTLQRPSFKKLKITDEGNALIRYSFDRLDRLNGYASGMTSPAWFQMLWNKSAHLTKSTTLTTSTIRQEMALTILYDIVEILRDKHSIQIPMPALTAAFEQMIRLARLRNRQALLREDVLDAIKSCLIKGDADADGAIIMAVTKLLFTGNSIGVIPSGVATPPLVNDFYRRARSQRLRIDDSSQRKVILDIYRRTDHRITSRLLHCLQYLGVPFAQRLSGPDFVNGFNLERIQEHWTYSWTTLTDAFLVESSLYGMTIPLATANKFSANLEKALTEGSEQNALKAASMLAQAYVLGIHDHLPRILSYLRQSINSESVFHAAANAVVTLALLWQAREPLEVHDNQEITHIVKAAYDRVIYLGKNLNGSVKDEDLVSKSLVKLREIINADNESLLDKDIFWQMLDLIYTQTDNPLIKGTLCGLYYNSGKFSNDELFLRIDGYIRGASEAVKAVSFLHGVLQVSREVVWHSNEMLSLLDTMVKHWDDSTFISLLPPLRLAFSEMTPRETDRIAEGVAQINGKEALGPLIHYDISDSDVQNNLTMSEEVVSVLTSDNLAKWFTS
jgi:hypothetical protein